MLAFSGFLEITHHATSALIVVCEIVELTWGIRYDIREVSANMATWTELMKGTAGAESRTNRVNSL